ncbi:MAG: isochorismatase family cysteine hydrolase [Thermodesulfobacteriota bacterium]
MHGLLIVDMLNDFVHPDGALSVPGAQACIAPVAALAAEFRRRGLPVVYTCDAHAPDDPEFADWPPHCVKGGWGAAVVPGLEPAAGDLVIEKRHIAHFDRYGVGEAFRARGVTDLAVAGVAAEYCVLAAALEARGQGFGVTLAVDGVAGVEKTPGDTERALERMRSAGVRLAPSAEIAAGLP